MHTFTSINLDNHYNYACTITNFLFHLQADTKNTERVHSCSINFYDKSAYFECFFYFVHDCAEIEVIKGHIEDRDPFKSRWLLYIYATGLQAP